MKYFRNPADQQVYGYDPVTQQGLIDASINAGWTDLTGSWPPAPAPATPQIPVKVTMRQARRALLAADLLNTVSTTIAAMPGAAGDAARIDWEFSSEVRRDWPLVAALKPVLNLTDTQIDQLFIEAAGF